MKIKSICFCKLFNHLLIIHQFVLIQHILVVYWIHVTFTLFLLWALVEWIFFFFFVHALVVHFKHFLSLVVHTLLVAKRNALFVISAFDHGVEKVLTGFDYLALVDDHVLVELAVVLHVGLRIVLLLLLLSLNKLFVCSRHRIYRPRQLLGIFKILNSPHGWSWNVLRKSSCLSGLKFIFNSPYQILIWRLKL